MFRSLFIAATLAACMISPAAGQDGAEEIVVTGARASQRNAVYADVRVPAIAMTRRADFVIADLRVSSDSRDAETRSQEVQRTLQNLAARARGGAVTLALQQDDTIRPFSMELAMRLLTHGGRTDTSQVIVHMRTAVRADDTLDTARQRFRTFAESVRGEGRALVDIPGDLGLTLRDIPQYRAPLIDAIVADARDIAGRLGDGYRAELTGLENPVAWRKSGDLQLTLFIDYQVRVVPNGA